MNQVLRIKRGRHESRHQAVWLEVEDISRPRFANLRVEDGERCEDGSKKRRLFRFLSSSPLPVPHLLAAAQPTADVSPAENAHFLKNHDEAPSLSGPETSCGANQKRSDMHGTEARFYDAILGQQQRPITSQLAPAAPNKPASSAAKSTTTSSSYLSHPLLASYLPLLLQHLPPDAAAEVENQAGRQQAEMQQQKEQEEKVELGARDRAVQVEEEDAAADSGDFVYDFYCPISTACNDDDDPAASNRSLRLPSDEEMEAAAGRGKEQLSRFSSIPCVRLLEREYEQDFWGDHSLDCDSDDSNDECHPSTDYPEELEEEEGTEDGRKRSRDIGSLFQGGWPVSGTIIEGIENEEEETDERAWSSGDEYDVYAGEGKQDYNAYAYESESDDELKSRFGSMTVKPWEPRK